MFEFLQNFFDFLKSKPTIVKVVGIAIITAIVAVMLFSCSASKVVISGDGNTNSTSTTIVVDSSQFNLPKFY